MNEKSNNEINSEEEILNTIKMEPILVKNEIKEQVEITNQKRIKFIDILLMILILIVIAIFVVVVIKLNK